MTICIKESLKIRYILPNFIDFCSSDERQMYDVRKEQRALCGISAAKLLRETPYERHLESVLKTWLSRQLGTHHLSIDDCQLWVGRPLVSRNNPNSVISTVTLFRSGVVRFAVRRLSQPPTLPNCLSSASVERYVTSS